MPSVLVVDDSPYVRLSLTRNLEAQGFEVVGQARNGQEAIDKNLSLAPDIILLDLQMPVMDGVEATRRIMQTRPTPILVFASLDDRGAQMAIQALAEGAYDVVAKVAQGEAMVDLAPHIWAIATRSETGSQSGTRPRVGFPPPSVVTIASSTGGPAFIESLVTRLPADFSAPVVIAQHMPAGFTQSLAERLDTRSNLHVFEATRGATVAPGQVAILPGGQVSTIERTGRPATFTINVGHGDLPGAKPNASALFFSALGAARSSVLGIVLTGMGADGSDAVRALVAAGARVIAQDAAEAIIPSMPNAARAAGAQESLTVNEMVARLSKLRHVPEAP